jgi:hypothetical protein
VVHVIDEVVATTTDVQVVPPSVTVAPARNPVPVIVINVLPANGPMLGLTEVTVGTPAYM